MTAVSAAVLAAAASGCRNSDAPATAKKEAPPTAQTAKQSGPCTGATHRTGAISWFQDQYQAALACAAATKKPLVIDAWAPWCHTCLSMQHHVLTDKAFGPLADRFVWLAIDTDKTANATAVAKYPQKFWPTFFIVSGDETLQARYQGAASVDQFRAFLKQGEAGHLAHLAGKSGIADPLLDAIRRADQAAIAQDWAAAAQGYAAAQKLASANSSRLPDILVARIGALYQQGKHEACLALARAELANTGDSASAADFVYYGSMCGYESMSGRRAPKHPDLVPFLEAAITRLEQLVTNQHAPLSVDDRSDAMRILREVLIQKGDVPGAKTWAERQRKLLDEAASQAPTPLVAMTYHWPRIEVYTYLGQGAELYDDLKKSVAALPRQYDPPYRLAWLYHKLGKPDLALPMAERAVALAYGPRKARVQELITWIHAARRDTAAQRTALEKLIDIYEQLPAAQKQPKALERAKAALAELGS